MAAPGTDASRHRILNFLNWRVVSQKCTLYFCCWLQGFQLQLHWLTLCFFLGLLPGWENTNKNVCVWHDAWWPPVYGMSLATLQFKKLKILALCVLYICACGRISGKGDRGKQSTSLKDLEGQVWLVHKWYDKQRSKQIGSRNRHQVNEPVVLKQQERIAYKRIKQNRPGPKTENGRRKQHRAHLYQSTWHQQKAQMKNAERIHTGLIISNYTWDLSALRTRVAEGAISDGPSC